MSRMKHQIDETQNELLQKYVSSLRKYTEGIDNIDRVCKFFRQNIIEQELKRNGSVKFVF